MIRGFTCSTFDLFHAGHVKMLEEARNQCHYLIVGLQSDPTIDRPHKNRPVQSLYERWLQLKACRYVDEIIPYATERELEDILLSTDIDVRILGQEYEHTEFTGRKICMDRNIKFYFNRRDHTFSTTELRQRVVDAEAAKFMINTQKGINHGQSSKNTSTSKS